MDWNSLAQSGIPSLSNRSTYSGGSSATTTGGFLAATSSVSTAQQQQRLPNLEKAISDYEEQMLHSILSTAEEETRKSTMEMIQASVQEHWERQRDAWLNELQVSEHHGHEESSLLLLGGSNLRQNNSSSLVVHNPTNQQLFSPTRSTDGRDLDKDMIQKHYAIINDSHFRQAKYWEIVEKFMQLASESEMTEYATMWMIVANLAGPMSETQRARGIAQSLAARYHESMIHRLPQSFQGGDTKAKALEFQHTFVLGDASIWPAVYFCLRCGDAVAAKSILEQNGSVVPAVLSLVKVLAQFQGNASNIWGRTTEFPFLDGHQIVAVKDSLERLKGNANYNKYEAGVYGLLSGEKPFISGTIEGFKTTQDYSYAAIVNVLLHSEDTKEGLSNLAQEINSLGPSHFKQASSWEFFLPLVAAQQFKRAFEWLIRVAPVQAVHLALGFSEADIPITNPGEEDTTSHVFAGILVDYASKMENPDVALKYLSLVPDKYLARTEMAKIIAAQANQNNLFAIAGQTNEDQGTRFGGSLSQVIESRDEVSSVLLEAASLLRSRGDNRNMVLCLSLAERFDQVLLALNSLLVPPEKQSQDRTFWVEQTKCFLKAYIDKSPSLILQQFTSSDRAILEETRILLAMNDLFSSKQPRLPDVLENLLPRSKEDFDRQVERCRNFSAPLQAAYGQLLLFRMTVLQKENDMLKRGQDFTPAVRADMERNKMLSDLYIRFTTSIDIPASDRHAIRQMGLMII